MCPTSYIYSNQNEFFELQFDGCCVLDPRKIGTWFLQHVEVLKYQVNEIYLYKVG